MKNAVLGKTIKNISKKEILNLSKQKEEETI